MRIIVENVLQTYFQEFILLVYDLTSTSNRKLMFKNFQSKIYFGLKTTSVRSEIKKKSRKCFFRVVVSLETLTGSKKRKEIIKSYFGKSLPKRGIFQMILYTERYYRVWGLNKCIPDRTQTFTTRHINEYLNGTFLFVF